MSRYRKIEVKIWSDEKFRALSPMQPSGQSLWLFLLTGPHTGPIPGLFRAGRAGMAEELGWEIEAFDKAFKEAFDKGMVKADFKARLVWLPRAINHNKPESPNVVKSWRTEFELLPECDLKTEALESLQAFVHGMGESFLKAFDEALGKPSLKPLPKTMPNQEQEQEQKQEQEIITTYVETETVSVEAEVEKIVDISTKRKTPPPYQEIVNAYHATLPTLAQVYKLTEARKTHIRSLWDEELEDLESWKNYFRYIGHSDFLMGRSPPRDGRVFVADFDFIIKPSNFVKIAEEKYHGKKVQR